MVEEALLPEDTTAVGCESCTSTCVSLVLAIPFRNCRLKGKEEGGGAPTVLTMPEGKKSGEDDNSRAHLNGVPLQELQIEQNHA